MQQDLAGNADELYLFQEPGWQGDNRLEEIQDCRYGDAYQPERDEQEPDDRIKDQSEQR